jgi:phosphoglycerate dehydrogenase-like enzyme
MNAIFLFFKTTDFLPGELRRLEEFLQEVRALYPDRQVVLASDRAALESRLTDIEIVAGFVPPDLLLRMPNLRWYQQWGAGADWLLRSPETASRDWQVTNVSGIHAIQISEHILAFLLAFARGLNRAIRWQEKHEWKVPEMSEIFELEGKALLLVGVGAIGERTARIAAALGMRVTGVRRDPAQPAEWVNVMAGPERLAELLPLADFVVITAPLTPETRGMFGVSELRAMKPSAYLINIGRGGTVQTEALVQALREGWIAGAGLDVVDPEPLPADSPLWDLPNVILTGHYSGRTPHYMERALLIFWDNLQRYKEGRPLRNVVDKQLGY